MLVGEPGIGKSWLAHDLAHEARRRGYVVASGACSQDDGAPPLWPWLGVLRALDPDGEADLAALAERGVGDESAARQAFETSDRIARALFRAAADDPVLVLLDDLHWADDATLRTLRHVLAETSPDSRLVVVATRRAHPEATGALAEVGEAFARRHALRLDLTGSVPPTPGRWCGRWPGTWFPTTSPTPGSAAPRATRSSWWSWPVSPRPTPPRCRPPCATW